MNRIFILLTSFSFLFFLSAEIRSQTEQGCSQKAKYTNLLKQSGLSGALNSDQYDITYYKFDLHVERDTTFVEGSVRIDARVLSSSLDTFVCQLHSNHTIDSIVFNGKNVPFIHLSDFLRIPLSTGLNQGSKISVVIYYYGTPPSGGSSAIGNGLSSKSSPSWGNEVTWSLTEPYSAYEWFPVKQELQDKADSVKVWISTNSANKVGSNGVLEAVTPLPNNMVRYEWKSNYPIAYYLISIAIAQYVDYTIYAKPAGYTDSIKIVNYIYDNPQTLITFKDEIDKTASMINVFSEKFGIYPFHKEKYGHSMAPFSGGMEHQTMTSQGFFSTNLTSHELAHQWFGDDVTCASWKDIFVNEGFASYLEYVYIQAMEPWRSKAWIDNAHVRALVPDGSVYVDDTTSVSRIFNSALSYKKGAFLLHMLRYEINHDSTFFAAMKTYRMTYSGRNATGLQFKKVMEQVSGKDFTDFFNQWYFGEGYPTFDVRYNQGDGNLFLAIDQYGSAPSVTPLFKTHLDINLSFSGRPDTTLRLYIDKTSMKYTIPDISGNLLYLFVDPDQWVLNEEGITSYDPTLGLNDVTNLSDISVYPNPTKKDVHIDFGKEVRDVQITVYNMTGETVYKSTFESGNSLNIEVPGNPGTYILKFQFLDGTVEEFKLVKE